MGINAIWITEVIRVAEHVTFHVISVSITQSKNHQPSSNEKKKDAKLLATRVSHLGNKQNRVANLTAVVNSLKERSLFFASTACNASDKLEERDLRDTSTLNIPGTQGNTQEMLGHIASTNKKICYRFGNRLTFLFASHYKVLEKIIIDQIPFYNQTTCFARSQILDDISVLDVLDCRKKIIYNVQKLE
ncbi:hypothetical protein BDC45DRAFT_533704 [Circinella umbellata]|nr:hypothetical protein BDC45DRAFT_533704 [Circinella umbellata]